MGKGPWSWFRVFFGLPCPAWASAIRLAALALPLCGAAPTFLCLAKEK